jgi:DtxR family Mn-dependent transcriptional regulator
LKITISKENYLKTIAEAENEGELVIAALLARWLNVSAPAVAMATRRLKRDGLISVARNGRIALTPPGRDIANRLIMRHHLIERMLTEVFGMEWFKVHDEAEQLEHAVSEDFERRLRQKLGEDAPCPHGSRMKLDRPQDRRKRGLVPLAELPPERGAVVECVFERDRGLLEYLDSLGIRPGSAVTVVAQNCDETYSLRVKKSVAPLGRRAAERIWVRPESTPRSSRPSS